MAGGRRDRGQYSMVDATYQESGCGWGVGETDDIMVDAMYKEPQCGGGSA